MLPPRRTRTRRAAPHRAAPRRAAPRRATPRHAAPRHAVPRHTTPRHAAPCRAAPRCATAAAQPAAAAAQPAAAAVQPAAAAAQLVLRQRGRADEPAALYLPELHSGQLLLLSASQTVPLPSLSPYPAGHPVHEMHAIASLAVEYFPAYPPLQDLQTRSVLA